MKLSKSDRELIIKVLDALVKEGLFPENRDVLLTMIEKLKPVNPRETLH